MVWPNFISVSVTPGALAAHVVPTPGAACRVDHRLHCNNAQDRKDHHRSTPSAQDQWVAHVNEVVSATLMTSANSWYMGANIPGKPRTFLPYLGPEGVVRRSMKRPL
jgi:hypothetical protein